MRKLRFWDEDFDIDEHGEDGGREDLRADEFIFAIYDNTGDDFGGDFVIYIAPAAYFEREGDVLDDHLPIEHLLPEGLHDVMEACYEVEGMSEEETKLALIAKGFVFSKKLQDFLGE